MDESTLYIVPTPIGNLGDITVRALDVLKNVDIIICEDTRHTLKLLNHYGIKKSLISYEKFSEAKKTDQVLRQLESGKNVALVSDAGTPLVSDPGSRIITSSRQKGIRIEVLPGPSAIVTALCASGFEGPFRFIGFFPRKKKAMETEIMRMDISREHTVFFESPHRVKKTMASIHRILGDRQVCLAREISKLHEEYIVGPAGEVSGRLQQMETIGEITIVVKGCERSEDVDGSFLEARARDLLDAGYSKKDILSVLTQETGLKRNAIYELLLRLE